MSDQPHNYIYCISGLGADEKIFAHLDFGNAEVHFIQWKIPNVKETISEYALRMASEIKHPNPVLVGVSFGGIIAEEISYQIPVKKIILISSVKERAEIPAFMRIAGNAKLDKLIPLRSYKWLRSYQNYRLGVTTPEEQRLADTYRKKFSQPYLNWSINKILNWKNRETATPIIQIHGNKDRIFPISKIKPDYLINGGTHMMVMNKADEINRILKKELSF